MVGAGKRHDVRNEQQEQDNESQDQLHKNFVRDYHGGP